ncbi:hypothetical protein G9A89_017875 [Geosiphon pyriformis]|nr:hypothetical protein G9A89_017875 [Geosiphon pyriformis]
MATVLILTTLLVLIPSGVVSCGCYGPCTTSGVCTYTLGKPAANCICDCCPVCNSCAQLFQGCAQGAYYKNYQLTLDPPITSPFKIGKSIEPRTVISQSTDKWTASMNGFEFCILPELPKGLRFGLNDSVYQLSGTPEVVASDTTYKVIFKGGLELLTTFSFTISVING